MMGDIAHLIRVFYTDSDDKEQWRRNLADRVAAQIALLQAEHRDYKQRAEAAEVRAADLAESNRELSESVTALRLELDLANAHAARLMQERDELIEWRDSGAKEIETLNDEFAALTTQNAEQARRLEEARKIMQHFSHLRVASERQMALDWLASTAPAPQAE